MKLNNGIEILQIGVGTWTLRGETAQQNVRLAISFHLKPVSTTDTYFII